MAVKKINIDLIKRGGKKCRNEEGKRGDRLN
jgi:hypothetical protein